MSQPNYELKFEYFSTAEINNSSLSEYNNLIKELVTLKKRSISEYEIFNMIEIPAEIDNSKLDDYGKFLYPY